MAEPLGEGGRLGVQGVVGFERLSRCDEFGHHAFDTGGVAGHRGRWIATRPLAQVGIYALDHRPVDTDLRDPNDGFELVPDSQLGSYEPGGAQLDPVPSVAKTRRAKTAAIEAATPKTTSVVVKLTTSSAWKTRLPSPKPMKRVKTFTPIA